MRDFLGTDHDPLWRKLGVALGAGFLLLQIPPALALMAGQPPDSPAARVDPNTLASPWNGVGSLVVGTGTFSGVPVAPSFVLTASHVVAGQAASNVRYVLNTTGDQSASLLAKAIHVFPSASFPYDDLALVELQAPLPANAVIYPVLFNRVPPGQVFTLVGYGSSGNGNAGVSVTALPSVKRTGQNTADLIQTTVDSSGKTSLFYLYDFDGPTGNGSFGGPTLGNGLETVVATGDSGSPAFTTFAGTTFLMGINTFVASPVANATVDEKFGTLGGGILLSDPRFQAWLSNTTGGTLIAPPNPDADVPALPAWGAALLSIGLLAAGRRTHR